MLNYQKNKLINLLLQFEIELNESINDIELMPIGSFTKKTIETTKIIDRNLKSIKKQINNL